MGIRSKRPGGSGAGRGDVPHEIITSYRAHIFPPNHTVSKPKEDDGDQTPPYGMERPTL